MLKRERPIAFWDIHEDNRVKQPFIYTYKHDPIKFTQRLARHLGVREVDWSKLDSTSESFCRKIGVPYVVTSETTPSIPMPERLKWLHQIYQFITLNV